MKCEICGTASLTDWTLLRYRGQKTVTVKGLCGQCRMSAEWKGTEIIKVSKDRSDLDLEVLKRML